MLGSDIPHSYNRAQFSEPAIDAEMDEISRLPFAQQPRAWQEFEDRGHQ